MNEMSPDRSSTGIYLQIVSNTPGRLRVRISPQNQDKEGILHMAGSLKTLLPQINEVKTNSQTGSITIYYSVDEDGSFEEALDKLQDFGIFLVDAPVGKLPSVKLPPSLSNFSQQVNEVTKNTLNLRVLVPFAVIAIVLKRLLPQLARWKTSILYLLLWYALERLIQQQDEQQGIGNRE